MKRVLITGSYGYVARHVQEALLQEGHVAQLMGVRTQSWMEKDFGGYDAIIHTAARVHTKQGQWEEWFETNVQLTQDLAKKAKQEGVQQFVFLSTIAVYAPQNENAINEDCVINSDTLLAPKSFYGKSKLMAEQALEQLQDECFKLLILRAPMIYGKNCPGNYALLRTIALKTPLLPKHQNKRSMIHIRTLCDCMIKCIEGGMEGVFLPQDKDFVCTVDMMQAIARLNGKKVPKSLKVLARMLPMAARMSDKAGKAFGNLAIDTSLSDIGVDYWKEGFDEHMSSSEPWCES